MRLFALRGATSVDRNDPQAILGATEWLIREIMRRNDLVPADVVSCIFTITEDLDAEFPAVAARNLGFDRVPLICAREVPVPGPCRRSSGSSCTTTPLTPTDPSTSTSATPAGCAPTSRPRSRAAPSSSTR